MTMSHLAVRAIAAIALPVVVLVGGLSIMTRISGHQQVEERARGAANAADRKPLDQRFGYDAGAVDRYWAALDGALVAERCFLQVDLIFPLLYGAALAASLWMAWIMLGKPFSLAWCLTPVAVTVLADWTENLVQLAQLRRYAAGGAPAHRLDGSCSQAPRPR